MKLRHNCKELGCYIEAYLPPWERMLGFFPRGIHPSDMDGVVEMNSHALLMEWKMNQAAVTEAQRMLLRKITDPIVVMGTTNDRKVRSLLLIGDVKNLSPSYIELFQLGASPQCIHGADKRIFAAILKDWMRIADGELTSWPVYA